MFKIMNLVGLQQNQDDSLESSVEDFSIIDNPNSEMGEHFDLVNESISNSESNSNYDINSVKSGLSSASSAPSSGLLVQAANIVLKEEINTLKAENAALKDKNNSLYDQLTQSSTRLNHFIHSVMEWRKEMTKQNADIRLKLETFGKEINQLKNENAELRKTDAATELKNNIVPNQEHALNEKFQQMNKKLEELIKSKQGATNVAEGNSSLQEHQPHPLKSKKCEIIQKGNVYLCTLCQTTFLSLAAFEKHARNCI